MDENPTTMAEPIAKTGDVPVYCAHDELVDIERIVPNPRNPNQHPEEQVELLSRIIRAHGWRAPITVSKRSGFIVRGHCRLLAARKLNLDVVPVDFQDYASEAEEHADLIADNRVAELAEIDDVSMAGLLKDLEGFGYDLELTGYTGDDLKDILAAGQGDIEVHEDGFDVGAALEEIKEPITKPGDIWILGEHRLMCGDSTKTEDVRKLMTGCRATLFATDPPYLVDYDGTNHPHAWNKPDNNKDWSQSYGAGNWDESGKNDELYDLFIKVAIEEAIQENAAWYCWHASRRQSMVEAVWEKYGAFVHQQIIWVKDRPILTRSWYMWQHEPCFMGWKRGNKPQKVAEDYPSSVWNIPTIPPGSKTEHPTSKPVELFAIPMQQHTRPGDLCYEPFAGSGSQVIAAEQLRRVCYAMEISPIYCDVIVRRWEAFTGKKGACL